MSELTVDQQLVANSDEHTMCCALPGSGKSHTMIALSENLVKKDQSYKVLLITFTKAAALELSERLQGKIDRSNLIRVKAATFDSIFGMQVRNGSKVRQRTIAGGEQYNLLERAMRLAGLDDIKNIEAMEWVDTYGRMLKPEPLDNDTNNVGWRIFQSYSELMKNNNVLDFNSIAREAYLGVQTGRFQPWDATHIIVDEFQDTSEMQYAWIQVHGELGAKIICVGDDDQSIYSWRGAAGYQNMVNFQTDFNAVGYVLKTCFRCRPEILESAKRVIEHNEDRVYKDMNSSKDAGGTVKVKGFIESKDEYEAIVNTISADNQEWAVLARTNRKLDEIEGYLKLHNIPYKRLGGKNLWDDHTAIIILKLLWSIACSKNPRYIGEILGWLGEDEDIIHTVVVQLSQNRCSLGDFLLPSWLQWSANTDRLHQKWNEWGTDVTGQQLVSRVKEIVEFLKRARKKKGKEERLIELVGDIIININVSGGFKDRVETVARNLSPKNDKAEEKTEKGVVTLASLHSSKGLQWSQVWIAASNQGVCPSQNALDQVESTGIEEERRLFYVGMTRAIDQLYMSFTHDPTLDGTNKTKSPSQFLLEGFPETMTEITKQLEEQSKKENKEDF